MPKDECACGVPRQDNGNCPLVREHGLPVQCVGPWARDKHNYLERYIAASAGPRRSFVTATSSRPRPGGAAFIDVFAGPGVARTHDGTTIDGSPLIAARHASSPFTKLILGEIDGENLSALRARTAEFGDRVTIVPGDSNANIDKIVALVPPFGLNFAFYDPFNPATFRWSTLQALGQVKRMDLLIHFPTSGVKRNFRSVNIDSMVGCTHWREDVKAPADTVRLFEFLRQSLVTLGYSNDQVRALPVKNEQHAVLYHLIYASKSSLGNKIWESIVKTEASGQRNLF